MFLNLWRRIVNQRIRASLRAHPSFNRPKAVSFRPQVEAFEDRILLSVVNGCSVQATGVMRTIGWTLRT